MKLFSFWYIWKICWSAFLILTFIGIVLALFFAHLDFTLNWRTASRDSANLAPLAEKYNDAVIQIYAARAYGWRGLFGVHTWLVTKEKNAKKYKIYQSIGWRSFYGLPPLSINEDIPDRFWFGSKPTLLKDIRGNEAEKLIPEISKAAEKYPYKNDYVLWPGPNSNTFIAYMARKIPALHLLLPPLALGKDYLGGFKIWARAPSSTGYQVALYGVLGILLAREEGLEINVLGLVFGINPKKRALILPSIGYIKLSK